MKYVYSESSAAGTTSNGQPDEEELVQLANAGDGLAYTELCRRHARRVLTVADPV